MKIKIYGPAPEACLIAEIVKRIPPTANECLIQAPLRYPPNANPCKANLVVYEASVDNKLFITVISRGDSHDTVVTGSL